MHEQTGTGIHLDDGAALRQQRLADVFGHQINARDIKPHHARGQHHHGSHFRVNQIGHVYAHVAGALNHGHAVFLGNAVCRQTLALQLQHGGRQVFQAYGVQRKVFLFATTRVGVDLQFNEFGHGMHAVAGDASGFAT